MINDLGGGKKFNNKQKQYQQEEEVALNIFTGLCVGGNCHALCV